MLKKISFAVFINIVSYTLSYAQISKLFEANSLMIESIMEDNFSPPVASRIQLYSLVAAREACAHLSSPSNSFQNRFKALKPFSYQGKRPVLKIETANAAALALVLTTRNYIYSDEKINEWINELRTSYKDSTEWNIVFNYATHISQWIIQWSQGDNYSYTRTLKRYELSDSLGAWRPTPPEYVNGLEPNWMFMRKVVFDSIEYINAGPLDAYSEEKTSSFFQNALAVYTSSKILTENQIYIAEYWDDNPLTTISKGHAMYTIKKPTPGGHWLKIAAQLCREKNIDVHHTSEVLALTSIAIYEGFIHCWNTKYQTNSIRPETYIQRTIDPTWKPRIETPPFPEYTSGHSVISAAAATVLTHYLGENCSFTDSSQLVLNLGIRKFSSLQAAAEEASISRFYGGIHYMPSLVQGMKQGQKLGQEILYRLGIK